MKQRQVKLKAILCNYQVRCVLPAGDEAVCAENEHITNEEDVHDAVAMETVATDDQLPEDEEPTGRMKMQEWNYRDETPGLDNEGEAVTESQM